MKQQGDNSNNIQIGNAGSGNTFSITQNQFHSDHALLVMDEDSVREYEKSVLIKDRNTGLAKMVGGGLLGAVGLFSDSIGITEYFGFSLLWFAPIGIVIGFLLALPHVRALRLLQGLPVDKKSANFIGDNEIVQESETGTVVTYRRSAGCIYPNCTGTIVLSPAPEREKGRLGRNYVGVCSMAGRDHSYRIDYIWNAYPESFDWRPVEINGTR